VKERRPRDSSPAGKKSHLAQTQEWREHHEDDLNDQEREFLDASMARQVQEVEAAQECQRRELAQAQALAAAQQQRAEEQARATKRLRQLTAVLAMVALAAVGVALYAREQSLTAEARRQESERLLHVSLAQVLAAQALHQRDQHKDERSGLLARQAYLFNQQHQGRVLDQVDDGLRTVLSAPHFSYILRGHDSTVMSVAFSERVVTGGLLYPKDDA
jgi:hypothetical protein